MEKEKFTIDDLVRSFKDNEKLMLRVIECYQAFIKHYVADNFGDKEQFNHDRRSATLHALNDNLTSMVGVMNMITADDEFDLTYIRSHLCNLNKE